MGNRSNIHKSQKIETTAIHAGEREHSWNGAIVPPIFQSSTFEGTGEEKEYKDIQYLRLNNSPAHTLLQKKISLLEHGESALVMASGMAAISTTLLTALSAGDQLLAQECLYGGTIHLLQGHAQALGWKYETIDLSQPSTWKQKLCKETKVVYVESITNPLLQVGDLRRVVEFAKEHGLVTIIDNTIASPVNFNPIDIGFDLVCHSSTKYMNGHSDIVAGCVIGRHAWIDKIKEKLICMGATLDPHACFLLNRGLKTMPLRVREQNKNAKKLAQFLHSHPSVEKVYYPGLETHPDHLRAKELFSGFSGVLSFELKGDISKAKTFLSKLTIPYFAPSLGGVETLITRPAASSHKAVPPKDRARLGIRDTLIRLSVGLEAIEDLQADLEQAL